MYTKLGDMESRFADLIWRYEPLPSGELAKLAEAEFSWKRTTTYTMLKRLCDRGIFENCGGVVSAVMSRDEFYAARGEDVVREGFGGSLPKFLAAFADSGRLKEEEIEELQALIDNYTKKKEG